MRMAQTTQRRRKVTFSLPADLVADVQALVAQGQAPSQSAFVAGALAWRVRQAQADTVREQFRRAGADPLFLRDVAETKQVFQPADAETARMIPD
jgi:Arc/MetJ-type ribon-helix-helix transcriptional regulator